MLKYLALCPKTRFAGAIPFLALAPPIAAGIPIIPADLVANAATLQVCLGFQVYVFLKAGCLSSVLDGVSSTDLQARPPNPSASMSETIASTSKLELNAYPGGTAEHPRADHVSLCR